MSSGRGTNWSKIQNVRIALRSSHDDRGEGQTRGWEQRRDDLPPTTNDPPQPTRPPYGYSQHYPSDPGPHGGYDPRYNPPPPPPQGSPPSQNYQGQYQAPYHAQYQAGFSPQGYGPPPGPSLYPSTRPQAYGQNQGYISPPPSASHAQDFAGYQQQPSSSNSQGYQGWQGTYPGSYNQAAYTPANNPYPRPPPPPPRSDSHHTQGLSQNTQSPSQSPSSPVSPYTAQSSGGSLSRTVTAPPVLHCEHRYPGDPP